VARKSPDAFRTISEVAEILEIPAHVLRFWESRFTQIKPVKRGGGRRYYRPQDIDLLRGIRDLLYDDGMTIKGVQKILRERGVKHVTELGRLDPTQDPIHAPGVRPDPPLRRSAGVANNDPVPASNGVTRPIEPVDTEAVPEAPFWAEPDDHEDMGLPEEPNEPPTQPEPMPSTGSDTPSETEAAPQSDLPPPETEAARVDAGPPLRSFPEATLPRPGGQPRPDTQVDLFSHAEKRDRRPFPPDPARAARTEDMRRILGKLEALREKMAAGLR